MFKGSQGHSCVFGFPRLVIENLFKLKMELFFGVLVENE